MMMVDAHEEEWICEFFHLISFVSGTYGVECLYVVVMMGGLLK